jgi:hypothetical protein
MSTAANKQLVLGVRNTYPDMQLEVQQQINAIQLVQTPAGACRRSRRPGAGVRRGGRRCERCAGVGGRNSALYAHERRGTLSLDRLTTMEVRLQPFNMLLGFTGGVVGTAYAHDRGGHWKRVALVSGE